MTADRAPSQSENHAEPVPTEGTGTGLPATPPMPEGATTVCVRKHREEIDALHDLIIEQAEAAGFDSQAQFGLRLAAEEAVSNGFRHGHRQNPDASVTVQFHVTEQSIIIRVIDEGPGFNPAAVPDPTADENIEHVAGRGLLLMRAYMTSVEYSGRGNVVTLQYNRGDKPTRG